MDGWNYWIGKKVYIILKNKRKYSGEVIDIDILAAPIIFVSIIDKFNQRITFSTSELEVIQEEVRQ